MADLPPQVLQGLGIPLPVGMPGVPAPEPSMPALDPSALVPPAAAVPPSVQDMPFDGGQALVPPQPTIASPEPTPPVQALPTAPVAPQPDLGTTTEMPAGAHPPIPAEAAPPAPAQQTAVIPPIVRPHAVKPLSPEQQLAEANAQAEAGTALQEQGIGEAAKANQQEARDEKSAMDTYVGQQADLNKQRAVLEADTTKTLATKQIEADRIRGQADNYKVDYNKFMNTMGVGDRVGWGIAAVMAGIGGALQGNHGPNPVIEMLQQRMKDTVSQQLDERERLDKRAGRALDDIDRFRSFSNDRRAQLAAASASFDQMLATQLKLAAIKAKDPIARSNALEQAGQLETSAAQNSRLAAHQATETLMAKQRIGLEASSLQLQRDKMKQDADFRQQDLDLKAADELRKSRADEIKAQKQAAAEGAVGNPSTREPLLNKDGIALREEAQTFEAQADKDPANARQLRATAIQLRNQASQHPAIIANKEDRVTVMDTMKYGQDMVNQANEMKAMLRGDPSSFDRDKWAGMQTKLGLLIADTAKSFKSNASSREFAALHDHVLTFEPGSMLDRVGNRGKIEAQLDAVIDGVQKGVNSELGTRLIADRWIPTSDDHGAAPVQDKDIATLAQGAPTSGIPRAVGDAIFGRGGLSPTSATSEQQETLANLGLRAVQRDLPAMETLSRAAANDRVDPAVREEATRNLTRALAVLPDTALRSIAAGETEPTYHEGKYSPGAPLAIELRNAAKHALETLSQPRPPVSEPYTVDQPLSLPPPIPFSPQSLINRFHSIQPLAPGPANSQ